MNIRDLEYFLAVAELQHFGKAAERCFVSQPTLSGQIKKLESTLGVKLFERTNRRVMLTDPGRQIFDSVKKVLEEVDRIRQVAKVFQNPFLGKFRLGAIPTLSTFVFPNLVQQVRQEMPDLRLILLEEKTEELLEKLHSGGLDAALMALPTRDSFLLSQELFVDEFYLAVSPEHALAGFESIQQDQLRGHRVLLLEEGHCLRDQALEVCSLHGIAEDQDFKATGLETLRQMVKAGTGITLMPEVAIREEEPKIRYIPFVAPVPSRTIGMVWRKTTARKVVIDRLVTCLRPGPHQE